MKRSVFYILTVCALFMGLGMYGQAMPITDVQERMGNADTEVAESIKQLIHGANGAAFISNQTRSPQIAGRKGQRVKVVFIKGQSDLEALMNRFPKEMVGVEVLNIAWDGHFTIKVDDDFLARFHSLKYIYIHKEGELNPRMIQNGFSDLIARLEGQDIEILFKSLNQAN